MEHRVALLGYAFRLPGTSREDYWKHLAQGQDLVTQVDADRWNTDAYLHPGRGHPGTSYTFAAGSIGDISGFDANFFGISPREAALMDPQQRIALEVSWEAFEHAGIRPSALRGSDCGVYLGVSSTDYAYRLSEDLAAIDAWTGTGNATSIVANRLSYFYDLRGPSLVVDTACSSSLVAFHQACQAIRSGEIRQAIAGGVSLHTHPYGFVVFSKASMLSPRGRCRAFDESADGYVRAEGAGLFVLKDYAAALKDGDRILAVVAHTAVNTDGRKAGLTVPNPAAQQELLLATYRGAGIDADTIDYLEAHGTGTAVGDPIEARAIGAALGRARPAGHPLPIGTVKNTMGHLEAASGVAGLVKVLHCLEHRAIAPTIGIEKLSAKIDFHALNIDVVRELRKLPAQGTLTMGVNSFGFGGVNAHAILQTPPAPRPTVAPPARATAAQAGVDLVLSARTPQALKAMARRFATTLRGDSYAQLYDKAYHSVQRRDWLPHRALVRGADGARIADSLLAFADERPGDLPVYTGKGLDRPSGPVFVYAGNGAQWAGMGKALLEDPVFLAAVRDVDEALATHGDFQVERALRELDGPTRFDATERAQPALFAIQVGITAMLRQRGIEPAAVLGHSVGEIAAAHCSGALTLADAATIIFHRSRLQASTRGAGQMSAVSMCGEQAGDLIGTLDLAPHVQVAGFNSPAGCTVAGSPPALEALEAALRRRRIAYKRLDLDYAFHCQAMDPIHGDVLKTLASVRPRPSRIPFHSTVTGARMPGPELDASYWWRNIRQPVRFQQALAALAGRQGHTVFVEIGPHAILRSYIDAVLKAAETAGRTIATGLRGDNTPQRIEAAAAEIILSGVPVDWGAAFPRPGRHASLPFYPWQRERFWLAPSPGSANSLGRERVHPLLGYRTHPLSPSWENPLDVTAQRWLADHVVADKVLFPAAGFAEIALAAAHASGPADVLDIEELDIRAALTLDADRSRRVRSTVAQEDGRVAIDVFDDNGDTGWARHADARILRGTQMRDVAPAFGAIPAGPPLLASDGHYGLMRRIGLPYGPAFRRIDAVWRTGAAEITARYKPAGEPSGAAFHLDPAVLDGAFQLAFHFPVDAPAGTQHAALYLPCKIGRLTVRRDGGPPAFVRAQCLRVSPHSLLARFVVADRQGLVIAIAQDVRLRAVPLNPEQRRTLKSLTQIVLPSPRTPVRDAAAPDAQRLYAALERRLGGAASHRHLQCITTELEPLLDILGDRYIQMALQASAGAIPPDILSLQDHGLTQASAASRTALWRHLIEQAVADGRIGFDAGRLVERPAAMEAFQAEPAPVDIWRGMTEDYPAAYPAILAVARAGLHLPAVLRGDADAAGRDKQAQRSSTSAALRAVIQGPALYATLDQALADIVGGLAEHGGPLRVLDIGGHLPVAGTRTCAALAATHGLCVHAPAGGADAGPFETLHERHAQVRRAGIDAVAASEDRYDLVVLQACDAPEIDGMQLLRMAALKLAAGGTLLLCGHHPSRWLDLVCGTAEGWWRLQEDGRPVSPQQSMRFWRQQLRALSFKDIRQWESLPDVAVGPYFLVARQPAMPPRAGAAPARWLILCDAGAAAQALARRIESALRDAQQHAACATCGDAAGAQAALRAHPDLDAVIDLVGYRASAPDADVADAVLAQAGRCEIAAAIARAAAARHPAPAVWLFTDAGAQALLPADGAGPHAIADAALWHFGRSLANETPGLALRLVDLRGDDDATLATLLDVLCHPDGESEIIVAGGGRRLVPRAVATSAMPYDSLRPPAGHASELAFDTPGQLHTLHWRLTRPPAGLADDEIEIDTAATGLNFRDVMYATGLLADEGIENGYTGPGMGLEFSGTVLRAGAAIHHLSAGDRVMGFARRGFANRIRTRAAMVAPVPDGMPLDAAATIPSVFFTVYYALHHLARLEPGERILIHGATGGIGLAAIQYARWRGAEIHATAGSPAKRDYLRLLGVRHIHDSRDLAYADAILRETGGAGVDVVLNSLAGEAITRNLKALRPFGRFIELGKRDFYENTRIGLRPFRNNISYFGVDADQLLRERPDLAACVFTACMERVRAGDFRPLPFQSVHADDIVDAFRRMQHAKHIGKIVVHYDGGIGTVRDPHPPRAEIDGRSTYLVTGGTRGFGLRVARWLADKGARHLVLASRSGAARDTGDSAIIARLREANVQVRIVPCDVGSREAVAEMLAGIAAGMPPLKGIVHAATVIDDGLAGTQEAARIGRAMTPKVAGAWHLHDLTAGCDLDHFILLSSVTALLGSPGQSAYVAANGWLEALARLRRTQGLAATCLQLGPIADAGFLAHHPSLKNAMQVRLGGQAVAADRALDILDRALGRHASGFGFLEMDWAALRTFLPAAKTPRLEPIGAGQGQASELDLPDGDLRALAETLSDAQLQPRIVALLRREIGQILRMPPDEIEPARPVQDLGLDSLMGVELVVALEAATGVRLPTLTIGEDTTVEKLAQRVLSALAGQRKDTRAATGAAMQAHIEALAARHDVPAAGLSAGLAYTGPADPDPAARGNPDEWK